MVRIPASPHLPKGSVVRASISLQLLVQGSESLPVGCDLSYNGFSDPMAVTAVFHIDGDSIEWLISRDLLADGMKDHVGLGDVQVWPCMDPGEEDAVFIALSSPEGDALLAAPARCLQKFLDGVFSEVPAGEEVLSFDPDLMDWAA